ncbi:MAG: type II toxin-antitoxin system PemK/MazF family toxin [bacterium]
MKRGEIWTIAGSGYAGKLRPALVIQSDLFQLLASVTVCLITSDLTEAEDVLRIPVAPTPANGLRGASMVCVDKIVTIPTSRVGTHAGTLEQETLAIVDHALWVFLGFAQVSP